MLKLNDDKTELIILSSRFRRLNQQISVCVGDTVLTPKDHVRDLGVIFDQQMLLNDQINLVCRTCYNNIRKIGRICCVIAGDATKALM